MQKVINVIITIVLLPLKIIKWIFSVLLIYSITFALGFVIDQYVGFPSVIKPIRDSVVVITTGTIKLLTPYIQNFSENFQEKTQVNTQAVARVNKLKEPKMASESSASKQKQPNLMKELQEEKTRQSTLITKKLAEFTAIIQAMSKKPTTTQPIPSVIYIFLTMNVILFFILSYILYQKI